MCTAPWLVESKGASRATAEAHFWHDHPEVLAGRDLVNRGTWLGVTLSGRFALLTNFREARLVFETTLQGLGTCGAACPASQACALPALARRRLLCCTRYVTSTSDPDEHRSAALAC